MKTALILILTVFNNIVILSNPKFEKWQDPSYFRGYNVLYESPKTLQDFIDFKNYGGNLFHIQPDGFLSCDAPYSLLQENIDGCDMLVNFCRQAGIYYVIGMRSGPGAYDTYDESQGTTGESRIWNTGNTAEQIKYSEMLQMVVNRYAGDSLFAGLNLVIEPRPKVKFIPANTSANYKFFLENIYNIHMDQVYSSWVSAIRNIDSELPIIIENFAYSTPELFPAYIINDPYVIYSAHNYQPVEFTKEAIPFSKTYPGIYWNISTLSQVLYDAQFIRETVFSKLKSFQLATGTPVFIGETGMYKPQNGGVQYLNDELSLFKEYGWHFALWDWRRGTGADWNIEKFGDPDDLHWRTVLSEFHAPPVPNMLLPENEETVSGNPMFTWDSMTAFTTYDIEISMVHGSRNDILVISDINRSSYSTAATTLSAGQRYAWRIRSKNPGGKPENISAWSNPRYFTVSNSGNINAEGGKKPENSLKQNYPNPFNPVTVIKYSILKNCKVKLTVYDLLGREVAELIRAVQISGEHEAHFNASSLSSGIYIYRIEAIPLDGSDGFASVNRMILIK